MTEFASQIARIQISIADGTRTGCYTNADDPRGKENATEVLGKRETAMQAAPVPQNSRVYRSSEVNQKRILDSSYSRSSSDPAQTEANQVGNERDDFVSSETHTRYAGLSQNAGNQASPASSDVSLQRLDESTRGTSTLKTVTRSKSDPLPHASQSRISYSRDSGLSGKTEQSEAKKAENETEQLTINATDSLHAELTQNTANQAPNATFNAFKTTKRLMPDEHGKESAASAGCDIGVMNISCHGDARREAENSAALVKEEIYNSTNRNAVAVNKGSLSHVDEKTSTITPHNIRTRPR